MSGFIKLWRSWLEHPIFQTAPTAWGRVALVIFLRANWKAHKWYDGRREILLPPGSMAISERKLAVVARTSRQQVRDALEYFENSGFSTSKRTQRHTVITLRNWGTYQSDGDEKNQPKNPVRTHKEPRKEPAKEPTGGPRLNANESGASVHISPAENEAKEPTEEPTEEHQKNPTRRSKNHHQEVKKKRKAPAKRSATSFVAEVPSEPSGSGNGNFLDDDDDDERKLPPEAVFLLMVGARHGYGPEESADVLQAVKRELGKAGASFEQFLEVDSRRTTNASALRNPVGHYVKLAQNLAAEASAAWIERSLAIHRAIDAAPVETPPCTICSRSGRLGADYCTCPLGVDLERADRHIARERVAKLATEQAAGQETVQ